MDYKNECIDYFMSKSNNPNNIRWVKHSINVAIAAERIAMLSEKSINPVKAFTCGLLHDIGRNEPNSCMHHIITGYNTLQEDGYIDESYICLTHSFFLKNTLFYQGIDNCTDSEKAFINEFLYERNYNVYDKLIQLCDALATTDGICIIEKRLVDVVMRTGFKDFTLDIWKIIFNRKSYFDNLCGRDCYDFLLDDATKNTIDKYYHIMNVC